MEMQWWIWLLFGIGLILLELVLPTFFILWFGIGAVLVALCALAAPSLQLDMQVLLWVVLSSTPPRCGSSCSGARSRTCAGPPTA
jgi:membrane protein implicated in regulation of membrane protease activity